MASVILPPVLLHDDLENLHTSKEPKELENFEPLEHFQSRGTLELAHCGCHVAN